MGYNSHFSIPTHPTLPCHCTALAAAQYCTQAYRCAAGAQHTFHPVLLCSYLQLHSSLTELLICKDLSGTAEVSNKQDPQTQGSRSSTARDFSQTAEVLSWQRIPELPAKPSCLAAAAATKAQAQSILTVAIPNLSYRSQHSLRVPREEPLRLFYTKPRTLPRQSSHGF
ncbi:hypothetical protein BY996DRAFT_6411019 [Phakopsora pachyrhizi]|nr:hypothetical protein BY996DRAFT_6411019 [Phakopsora pachyrhizi]